MSTFFKVFGMMASATIAVALLGLAASAAGRWYAHIPTHYEVSVRCGNCNEASGFEYPLGSDIRQTNMACPSCLRQVRVTWVSYGVFQAEPWDGPDGNVEGIQP